MRKLFTLLLILFTAQFAQAQCSVLTGPTNDCSYGDAIDQITIDATTWGYAGCTNPSGYSVQISPILTLTKGNTYSVAFTVGGATYDQGVSLWIDWNQNNLYDAADQLYASGTAALTHTGTITIPAAAVSDTVPMRIMCAYNNTIAAGDACVSNQGSYGETEDYLVILVDPANAEDAGVTSIDMPSNNDCVANNDSVVVTVENFGTDTLTNLMVDVDITGSYTGNVNTTVPSIAPGVSMPVFVGTAPFTAGGNLNFLAYTTHPGDTVNNSNDSTSTSMTVFGPTMAMGPAGPICSGSAVTLTASGNAGATYDWYADSTGGSSLLSGDSVTTGPLTSDSTFWVETTTNGCPGRVPVSITVLAPAISMWNSSAVGFDAMFTDMSTSGGSITGWMWDFGDGNTSTMQNPTHTYGAEGTFTVCLTVTDSCGSDSSCSSVTITCPAPSAAFTSSMVDLTGTFTNTSTGGSSYAWDFGDGNTSTMENPTHTYANAGVYTVCLTVTDSCGSSTACDSNVIALVGVEPGWAGSLEISPNPTSGPLRVNVDGLRGDMHLELHDATGRLILSKDYVLNGFFSEELDLREYSSGMYFLKLEHESGIVSRQIVLE